MNTTEIAKKLTKELKSTLLSRFEKLKGYSSDLFDGEEWREFDTFCIGYALAKIDELETLPENKVSNETKSN